MIIAILFVISGILAAISVLYSISESYFLPQNQEDLFYDKIKEKEIIEEKNNIIKKYINKVKV